MTGFLLEMNFALCKNLAVIPERERRKNPHPKRQKNKVHNTILIKVHAIKEMKLQLYKAEDTNYV